MIRRFLYHGFWNFYDYLGTYALLGAAQTFVALALLYVGSCAMALPIPAAARILTTGIVLVGMLCLFAASCAGLFPFAQKAAQDLPARFSDFRAGIRQRFGRYLLLTILAAAAAAVIAANVRFYLLVAHKNEGTFLATAMGIISAAFGWAFLVFSSYAASVFATAAACEPSVPLRSVLRRAFVVMAIAPGFWLFALIFWAVIAAICIVSHAGIIFVIPGLASAASTGVRLISQHGDFLAEARTHIGASQSLAAYKRKAAELAEEWEARQPKRTLRELLKPWEY